MKSIFILVISFSLIWGIDKKALIQKKFAFQQFAVVQQIKFDVDGTYLLYLENAMTPRTEKGRYKLSQDSVFLRYEKCLTEPPDDETSAAERAKERKFTCDRVWGDLKCVIKPAKAITYSEVLACDRVRPNPEIEKSPLMVLQNVNSRPKPDDIVEIDGRQIKILPDKPLIAKSSTHIFDSVDENKVRSCPGPTACKAPYMTIIGKPFYPHGKTVQKYLYKGKAMHWYVLGSDEYGLYYLPEIAGE